jgi:hypothetical protein
MINRHTPLQALLLLASALTAMPTTAEHREHGTHVHGSGQLNVVLDGTTLEIELDSPAANLVGFEHAPRNADERGQLEQAMARLHDTAALFTLPAAAGCQLQEVKVAEEGAGEEEGGHGDINALYRFTCNTPSALRGIELRLFELYPLTERLAVQLIGPGGQQGLTLTPTSRYLSF